MSLIAALSLILSAASLWAAPYACQLAKSATREHDASRRTLDADSLHGYDMLSLDLDYSVTAEAVPMTGIATVQLLCRESMDDIPFNAEGTQILSVTEGDAYLPFVHGNDTVWVERPAEPGDTLRLSFMLSVPGSWEHSEVGFHWGVSYYTFGEPYGSRRWYPCWDQPYDKFDRIRTAVEHPDDWSLASNGVRVETTYPAPGRRRDVYEHDHPISTYLVMMAAGPYAERYETVNGVDYRYFTWRADSMKAAYDWERTPQMVQAFSERYGAYPFREYGMVEAELFYGWGAMEHQTFTTMGYHLLDSVRTYEGIVAHELSHQWFGDHLSPVDFRHIWLNEGFATFCDVLWSEVSEDRAAYLTKLALFAEHYFAEDRQFRYASYDPPPQYLFGTCEYQKPAWMLHMLREQLLGDSLFYAAIREYVERFAGGNVATEDFIQTVEDVSGRELQWFFDQWIYGMGHPELEISVQPGAPDEHHVTVTVEQRQQNAPLFTFPLAIQTWIGPNSRLDTLWFSQVTQSRAIDVGSGNLVSSASLSEYQPLLYQGTGAALSPSNPVVVTGFTLAPAYPNPFNAVTHIPFTMSQPARVVVDLFDISGRFVARVVDGNYAVGPHAAALDLSRYATGVYLLRAGTDAQSAIQRLVLLK
ncbi:T9SS type A sorting domain-containing protein [candidate division KSB1 bacterium]|nr:T9SS type A sorting domain-containing protein [candidate division KSB1 bacterium]